MRASGILMPIFSLPSKYGIGTLGEEAYKFIDFLKKAGQTYWQILPLSPTSYGDSPYQSFSSYAGNPYFIDLDILSAEGLLKESDYADLDFGDDLNSVDYEKIYNNRYPVLRKASENFFKNIPVQYEEFCKTNSYWLETYCCFMALKDMHGGICWREWDEKYKYRNREALSEFIEENKINIDFYKFLQFEFFKQWKNLKKYANDNGIKIIGDMPIYVADDSTEVWSEPEQFDLKKDLTPRVVSGHPPDAFSADGQLWGSPTYAWKKMEIENVPFSWWRRRVMFALNIYDILRLDHFCGFESFFAIPAEDKTAANGKWVKGPGIKLFNALKEEYGKELPIIAEDLGHVTPEVKKLLAKTGFPGIKVLQFGFDSRESNDYLPHNYIKNCVVYTGTHDNDTSIGWLNKAYYDDAQKAIRYMHMDNSDGFNWHMIRLAMMSVADTSIIPMTDILSLDSRGRINQPSTLGTNWKWRMQSGCTNDWLAGILWDYTKLYSRLPE